VSELRGEKIDIVNYSPNPEEYIKAALSPSKVIAVETDTRDQSAKIVVADHQLSLAIGKEGQNARLAVKLTGWKIDIKSASQAKSVNFIEELDRVLDGEYDENRNFDDNEKAEVPDDSEELDDFGEFDDDGEFDGDFDEFDDNDEFDGDIDGYGDDDEFDGYDDNDGYNDNDVFDDFNDTGEIYDVEDEFE